MGIWHGDQIQTLHKSAGVAIPSEEEIVETRELIGSLMERGKDEVNAEEEFGIEVPRLSSSSLTVVERYVQLAEYLRVASHDYRYANS